ncbi:hypothetical protein LAZ67_14003433 [Cordylochernes scorpioides]|uniref:Histone-lysine N-methyltransferase SETMAR n=1 Tax=Cordylochernes scorpioides TaxID=51811 RepID=A0ABY6LB43_9ARAC|nr:hypothetical protein LAZ67_14003433 [Cordylochernes scorpioides]
MNSDLYCDILVNKLKPGIRNKRRGKLSKGVLFLHDNARPHTSCKTVSTIIKLGSEVLEHPAYSPDLAPSDYFLFGLLKKELKGKRFDSDEDVQKVVQDFFHTFPESAYKEGIYKLPERWRRCIESQGKGKIGRPAMSCLEGVKKVAGRSPDELPLTQEAFNKTPSDLQRYFGQGMNHEAHTNLASTKSSIYNVFLILEVKEGDEFPLIV